MNEATAYHAVHTYFSARRRWTVQRFELMKMEDEGRFLRKNQREHLMFVTTIVIVSCNLASERMMRRGSYLWEDVVCGSFSSEQLLENFRMSRSTFQYLCSTWTPIGDWAWRYQAKESCSNGQTCCTRSGLLLLVLSYWTIAHHFIMSKSTVRHPKATALLYPFPTIDALREVVDGFKRNSSSTMCWCCRQNPYSRCVAYQKMSSQLLQSQRLPFDHPAKFCQQ